MQQITQTIMLLGITQLIKMLQKIMSLISTGRTIPIKIQQILQILAQEILEQTPPTTPLTPQK